MFTVNRNPSPKELRGFGSAMLAGFGVLGIVLWSLRTWRTEAGLLTWDGAGLQWVVLAMWIVGVALFALSRISLSATRSAYVGWMSAAMPLGWFMMTVLLSVMYFLFLPVFALIVSRNDPMRKRLHDKESYWEDHGPFEATLERMRRLF